MEEGHQPRKVASEQPAAHHRRAGDGPATVRRLVHLGDRVKVEAQVDGAGSLFAQVSGYDPVLRELEPGARVAVDVEHARSYPLSPLEPCADSMSCC